nr:unnamed protein product [Digitaria exilis]
MNMYTVHVQVFKAEAVARGCLGGAGAGVACNGRSSPRRQPQLQRTHRQNIQELPKQPSCISKKPYHQVPRVQLVNSKGGSRVGGGSATSRPLQPGARGRTSQAGRDRRSAEWQAAAGMRARPTTRPRPMERERERKTAAAASRASGAEAPGICGRGRAERGRRWARERILKVLDKDSNPWDPVGVGNREYWPARGDKDAAVVVRPLELGGTWAR